MLEDDSKLSGDHGLSREWVKRAGDRVCFAQHLASTISPCAVIAFAALVSPEGDGRLDVLKAVIAFVAANSRKNGCGAISPELARAPSLDDAAAVACAHGKRVLGSLIAEVRSSSIAAQRRARVQLRYCCGQLLDLLAPLAWSESVAASHASAPQTRNDALRKRRLCVDELISAYLSRGEELAQKLQAAAAAFFS